MSANETAWEEILKTVQGGGTITGAREVPSGLSYDYEDSNGQSFSNTVLLHRVYIVGIDIVGYSRRSHVGQLLLTTWLYSVIRGAINNLRQIGWIGGNQPGVLIPTGDGAMLVVDDIGELAGAASLIYNIQMWVEDITCRRPLSLIATTFNDSEIYPILPIHCRYVLTKGDVVFMNGLNGERNAVGPALVSCARLLAASKGAHYLIDAKVMDDFDRQSGINGVQSVIANPAWDWSQRLHFALMPQKQVKTANLMFYNVFGHFQPAALIAASFNRGKPQKQKKKKQDFIDSYWYNIGSHDVSTIVD